MSKTEIDLEPIRFAGRAVLAVRGMWCASCAMALQRSLGKVPGIQETVVNFISGSVLLRWDPDSAALSQVVTRAHKLGYELSFMLDGGALADGLNAQARRIRLQLAVAVVFGMWSMLGSWVLYLNQGISADGEGRLIAWFSVVTGLAVIVYSGQDFFRAAFNTLRAGFAGMDALICIGAVGALVVSIWNLLAGSIDVYMDAATMLVTFLLAGRLIEIRARQENGVAMRALAQLTPEVATRICDNDTTQSVPIDNIEAGDLILIRAAERVPADGVIVHGQSELDTSLLTGESFPVAVAATDEVLAGTVNLGSPLQVRVTASAGHRRIDLLGLRMIELFGARPSLSMAAERFVRWLLPVVTAVAILAFARYLWIGVTASQALISALSLFVAACPCAVGLSMPLAYALGSRRAAERGILWRDPASVESLARSRVIAFDKTGTLTTGLFKVAGIQTAPGIEPQFVGYLAAKAEYGINHPIATALRLYAQHEGWPERNFMQSPTLRYARGVSLDDEQGTVLVGARTWLRDMNVQNLPQAEQGPGMVHVSRNGLWQGAIRLQDTPREQAHCALKRLAADGTQLWLITGDSAQAAGQLIDELQVDFSRIVSSSTPEQKAQALCGAEQTTTFVGDGVNDVLALASADCGIAVSSATAVAASAAGVVVTRGGAEQIVWARHWARRTYRIVKQNLIFSVAYNALIVMVLFASGVTPFAAAIAMLLSSVSVCINATRLAVPSSGVLANENTEIVGISGKASVS
ncbi:metal transporter ATPase [Advenella kashmirensis WT001]|uniref:Metal transporter ATPase n=1 Tax=Advenella kashmirensis (strain DSM 17095 / LMG 22695 / WT001) TaxID=1036672 RepID=I3UCV1_ADVKW|nr:cation-translocating P-type ATPase [Advenella kashmirensis]AFK62839.1 metal transporter ATPase [Advenella kashmirensis WT001]